MPDPAALAAAIHRYRTVERRIHDQLRDPWLGIRSVAELRYDLEAARTRLATFGDPAVILGETRNLLPDKECGNQ